MRSTIHFPPIHNYLLIQVPKHPSHIPQAHYVHIHVYAQVPSPWQRDMCVEWDATRGRQGLPGKRGVGRGDKTCNTHPNRSTHIYHTYTHVLNTCTTLLHTAVHHTQRYNTHIHITTTLVYRYHTRLAGSRGERQKPFSDRVFLRSFNNSIERTESAS